MDKSYTSKFKFIVKVLTLLCVLNVSNSWGQLLQWNTFGNLGTETSEPSIFNDPNLSASTLTLGAGITAAANGNRLGGSSWSTSLANAITGNDYIEFTVTPAAGCSVTPTSFIFNWQTSNAVFTTVTLRSSADGFAADIGSQAVTTAITQYTITIPAITNNPGPLTFRLYGYGATIAAGTTGGFDQGGSSPGIVNVQLNGTTSCVAACTAPTTTITPTTQTVCAGSVTTLTVTSSATVPTYTWQASANGTSGWANVVNGTPAGASYSGLNTSTLSITAGSSYFYQCLVTENGTCTATSATSTLVVNTSPTITSQPSNTTICTGNNALFTVAATGSPLTYQWQEKVGAGAFANIANGGVYGGATSATLVLTNPGIGMSTNQYQCIVSVASCSSVTTTAAVLTINTTPATPPAPIAVANPACTTGTLAAASSTVAGVTWYWQGSVSTASVATQSTATDYTFSTSNTYYVRALDASGTCWSATSSLSVTVNAPVTITTQPSNKEVCMVGNTSFAVSGTGTAPKQWQYSADGGITFTNVPVDAVHSNVTNATMNLTGPTTALNGYVYQCLISVVGCPAVTTNTALLNVYQTPTTPPTPTAAVNPACSGTSLIVMTSTVAGVTWYWQGTTAAGSSTTSPTSSQYNVSASGTYYVRARADGSSCLSSSSSISVTINAPPAVTTDPADRTQCVGTNTTFVVAATGTSLTYQWQLNTGSGFSNLTNVAPYSNVTTATMSITNITAGMTGYQYQCVISGASPCAAATSNYGTLIITASGTPVTPASAPVTNAVACNAFNLSWTSGSGSNRLVVVKSGSAITGSPVDGTSYTANTAFGSGGTIAAGEFVVYKGIGSSVFITGLSPSTTYYYKIFEFNGCSLNYLTSGTVPSGNATTTSCSASAGITAVYIDACAGGCGFEGSNEIIWGTSGSYGLKVATNGPTLHYDGTTPPTTTKINIFQQSSSNLAALNTAVGACGSTTFVDPNTLGYIPANSRFLVANICMCTPAAYDFSGLCGSGPIYVLFGTGPAVSDWPCGNTSGIFGNKNCGGTGVNPRYFDFDFTALGVSLDPIYSFTPCALTGGTDGDIALFNPSGGPATTYSNSACKIPLIVLPIDLIDFYATKNGKKNDIVWKVASEENVVYYTIGKSNDGVNFAELATVFSNNETQRKTYSVIDDTPFDDITYYRLGTKEKDGKVNYYKIISIDEKSSDWKSIHYQQEQNLVIEFKNTLPKNSSITLFDLSGKLLVEQTIKESQTIINTQAFAEGIYFVKIATPYKTENFKIIITK